MNGLKVIIVDDNKTFRESFKFYLEEILHHRVTGMAGNGEEFMKLNNSVYADVILMDIEMPEMNGIEAILKSLWKNPHTNFIAITSYKDKAYLTELIEAGFKGCIFKEDIHENIQEALSTVREGKLFYPDDIKL